MEIEEKVLVIRRIHVIYTLRTAPENRGTAERVLGFHARSCPVARSIGSSIEITTSLVFEEVTGL